MFDITLITVFLIAIFLGVRMGGIGIAYAAGIGLFIITMLLGVPPGELPINVIIIIAAVIGAISVLQLSGGLDYIVYLTEKLLKKHPKYINFLAPTVTFFLTVLAGTGHISYSVMPVIIQVAKNQGIRPVRPLTTAVIGSQVGIIASPISAAVVALVVLLAPFHITLGQILLITLPSVFVALMLTAFIQTLLPQSLSEDKNYQALLARGKEVEIKLEQKKITKYSLTNVLIFLLAIAVVVMYGLCPSLKPIYNGNQSINMALLIVIVMLFAGYVMAKISKVNLSNIAKQTTFQSGMIAILCVIGVAWLGDTVISYYSMDIKNIAGSFLKNNSWSFAVVIFLVSMLLYSQAATTIAMIPLGISLGLSPSVLIPSFIATCALFVLPTYPTLIAAVQMDYTGTTKIGKYVFNHSFILPLLIVLISAIILAFIMANLIL